MTGEGVSRRRLWALGPPVMPVRDRLRLGLPTIVILVGGALAGHLIEGLLVGLGTYTVLFGGIPARRRRALVMAGAGVGLLGAVVLGALVSDSLLLTLLAFVAVAALAVGVDSRYPLGPPGLRCSR